jgi:hypothetical protein
MLAVPDTIVCADNWLVFSIADLVETGNYRTNEIGTKSITKKLAHYDLCKCVER